MQYIIKQAIDELVKTQHHKLEIFAAAFLHEVGSTEASKYQLVEERSADGLKIVWRFELR